MKSILTALLICTSVSYLTAQTTFVNQEGETLPQVEVLKGKSLVALSDEKGRIPNLTVDSVYTAFHPNYPLLSFTFGAKDTFNLGAPIHLFESVDIDENEVNLYQRIYDSTYNAFVEQKLALLGDLWIYQKYTGTTENNTEEFINVIHADVAYVKHEKRKKETWYVKGEPQRMFSHDGALLGPLEFRLEKHNFNKFMEAPDKLSSFLRYKKFSFDPEVYKEENFSSNLLAEISLTSTTDKGFVNSHDIKYASLNFKILAYRFSTTTPVEGVSVLKHTLKIPKDENAWKFVNIEGKYYPETMLFNSDQTLVMHEMGITTRTEYVYIFKVKEAIAESDLTEEYEEQNFSNDKFLKSIAPSKEILNFPYLLEE